MLQDKDEAIKDEIATFIETISNRYNKKLQIIVSDQTSRMGLSQLSNAHSLTKIKNLEALVLNAMHIQDPEYKYVTPKFDPVNRQLKIALSSGVPVTSKDNIFEEATTLATRMCDVVNEVLVISSEVKLLFESENRNIIIDEDLVRVLKPSEEVFLTQLMDYIENFWNKPNFNVGNFSKELGYSKSQLYRKLMKLTGKSSSNFLRAFRLDKALGLLHKQYGNISEIAYETGFNSPAYFSKCFLDKYGILPSKYVQQHIV